MRNLLPGCMLALLSFTACQTRDHSIAIKSVNNSLEHSNELLQDGCSMLRAALDEKTKDPATRVNALIWQPKGRKVAESTTELVRYVNNLKNKLKELGDVGRLPDEEIAQLDDRLLKYNSETIVLFDAKEMVDSSFLQESVRGDIQKIKLEGVDANPLLLLAMLSRLQNDLLVTESNLLTYCLNHSKPLIEETVGFQPVVAMDRSYVRSGERIEITAGMGIFYHPVKAIIIDGKQTPVDKQGMATYQFIAAGKPGKYTVPLTIEYFLPDGAQGIVNKLFNYTIVP